MDKLKILLIANYLPDAQQSMLRFAKMVEAGLRASGHDVKLIRPEPVFGRIKKSATGFGKWLGYLDKFVIFQWYLKRVTKWADVVHICDHSNAFYTKYLKDIPHVVTCHDLLAIRSALGEFKENPTKWSGRQLQRIILDGINNAHDIICVSQETKNDLLHISKFSSFQVGVIYDGLNYSYFPMSKDDAQEYLKVLGINFEDPYILHVGKNNWYKNRKGLLEIFGNLAKYREFSHYNLVIAGTPLTRKLQDFARQNNIKQKIYEVRSPSNESLCALYSKAKALIYPSIAEGFGWPIIEAQACGCPVFTTGRSPMTEAGGDAAVYFDPESPEEATQIISETLRDNDKVAKMKEAGLENIKRFSTDRMIEDYVKVYRKAIEENQCKNKFQAK